MKKFIVEYDVAITVFLMLGTGILSILPPNMMVQNSLFEIPWADKIGHFCMYAILGFFWNVVLRNSKNPRLKAVFFVVAFGIFMELIQFQFILGRYFEIFDIIANITGCIFGTAIYLVVFSENN